MKFSILAGAVALALSAPAWAAPDVGYEKGPVWDMTSVKTVDGHFDDYMKYITSTWKVQQEALKKAGMIIDYKVFVMVDPRNGEPDIVLANEYRNLAALDHPIAEDNALFEKIAGSMEKANKDQAARGVIRSVVSEQMMREVVLK